MQLAQVGISGLPPRRPRAFIRNLFRRYAANRDIRFTERPVDRGVGPDRDSVGKLYRTCRPAKKPVTIGRSRPKI